MRQPSGIDEGRSNSMIAAIHARTSAQYLNFGIEFRATKKKSGVQDTLEKPTPL